MNNTYDKAFNKHIREARKAVKGLRGYERAEAIRDHFAQKTNHPHPGYTFDQAAINRSSDHQLATYLMKEMAWLCAENEALVD